MRTASVANDTVSIVSSLQNAGDDYWRHGKLSGLGARVVVVGYGSTLYSVILIANGWTRLPYPVFNLEAVGFFRAAV